MLVSINQLFISSMVGVYLSLLKEREVSHYTAFPSFPLFSGVIGKFPSFPLHLRPLEISVSDRWVTKPPKENRKELQTDRVFFLKKKKNLSDYAFLYLLLILFTDYDHHQQLGLHWSGAT